MLALVCASGLGWTAARLYIPVPAIVYVSPVVVAAEASAYRVRVPFAGNVRWAVQSGDAFCEPKSGRWGKVRKWTNGPAEVTCLAPPLGVRLVVQGFAADSQVAGALITVVPPLPAVPVPFRLPQEVMP